MGNKRKSVFVSADEKSDLSLIGIDINPSSNPDLFVKFVQQLSPVVSKDVIEKIEYIEAGVYKWYYQLGQYKARRKSPSRNAA